MEELLDAFEDALGAARDVGALLAMGEDRRGEIRDGDVDARRAEVGHEDAACVRAEPHHARCATAARLPEVAFLEQPVLDELAHALRRDGAAQAGAFDDQRPGRRAVASRVVEHRDEVEKPIVVHHGNGSRHGRSGLSSSRASLGTPPASRRKAQVETTTVLLSKKYARSRGRRL
jgi:hypothetical protein